jgi:hypothetical protein
VGSLSLHRIDGARQAPIAMLERSVHAITIISARFAGL